MLRKTVAFLCVVVFVGMTALSAQAAVVGIATLISEPPGTPFTNPEAALGAPWVSYQLSVMEDSGINIQAVDVTIGGQLHQRWSGDSDFNGVADPTPNGIASNTRGDTHLTAPNNAVIAIAYTEDNDRSSSPLSGGNTPGVTEWGVGTMLRGAWAIPGADQTTAEDFALIVIPKGTEPQLDFRIEVARPGQDAVQLTAADFFGGSEIPEPTAVALAGLAMVGLVGFARRRRNG